MLPGKPLPEWLANLTTNQSVPWRDLLQGSLYYAACGTDGRPVQYLAGHCHSFVYADYGYSCQKISELLNKDGAFHGYSPQSSRQIEIGEIDLVSAWDSIAIDPRLDGVPDRYRDRWVVPYLYWCIFERLPGFTEAHGPQRFSVLYAGLDGVAAFQALYVARIVAPAVVAIIQPGEGFGWNWTHFFDSRQIFCRTVLGNPAGIPDYLLLGGHGADKSFQRSVVWPRYDDLLRYWRTSDGHMGLWRHV